MDIPESLLNILKSAEKITFFTGAGISAESGISTFRGADGLWNKLKPEELASFDAFMKNPDIVWEWYEHRRSIANEKQPNSGHYAIAEFEKFYKVVVVTQNVDNLHCRAGSSNILELHGNIMRNYCINCRKFYEDSEIPRLEKGKVPECTVCGGWIRPDVVWFGEMLPQDVYNNAEFHASTSDICFVVGTSAVVYPAMYIPFSAKSSGAVLVEVNIEKTDFSSEAHYNLFGKSGEVLPAVLNKIKELKAI